MAHRMTRRIHALERDRLADLDVCARADSSVNAGDLRPCMRDHLRAGRGDDVVITCDVVGVLVGVEHLRDLKASPPRDSEALFMSERIDRERFAGLLTSDQVIVIPEAVPDPHALDDHDLRRASTTSITSDSSPTPSKCSISRSPVGLVMLISVK